MEVKPGYKQTEVGVIPEQWDAGRLEEYFSFISYGFTNPMPTVEYGIYMITAADISNGRIQFDAARHTSEVAYRTFLTPKSKPKKDDILLTKDGSLGRLALVGDEVVCINQSVAVIRPNERVEPVFLKLLLESPSYQKKMLEEAGGSTIKHIYISIVNLMSVAIPKSRAEQRAIAGALSDVDALIGALDQLIAKKRDLKQAAMQQLLTGQRRLPGFHGEWEAVTAGEIGRFRGGSGFPLKFQGQPQELYPFYKVSDMNNEGNEIFMSASNNWISEPIRKALGATLFPANSIVFAKVGAAIFLERKKILTQPSCIDNNMAAFVLNADRAACRFVHYLLLNAQLAALVATTALPSLNGKQLSEIAIKLPPLPEQTAIAEVLSDMDAELAALGQRRDKTRALKQGMMQELLTGRIRLRN